jgi:hypothetical protein
MRCGIRHRLDAECRNWTKATDFEALERMLQACL